MNNANARDFIRDLPFSGIRDVVRSSADLPDVIPLWFGEGDAPTPEFIRDAAKVALDSGQTFYTPNLGIEPLRAALADYQTKQLPMNCRPDNICVTSSGMNALNLVASALVDPGDEVVAITPAWPNLPVVAEVSGAKIIRCPLDIHEGKWRLDLDKLRGLVTARTRAIMVNSPSNPTGWMAEPDDIAEIVALAAEHGTWIISDEVYARIVYDRPVAPSFLAHLAYYPRIVAINSFSKAWAMTGWRLGWITAQPQFIEQLERLMEFNISCAPPFTQVAAIAALEQGEDFIKASTAGYKTTLALLLARAQAWPDVEIIAPDAAFYAMLRVAGLENRPGADLKRAKQIARDYGVGLAPGSAFGPEAAGQFRLCYATSPERIVQALDRLDTTFKA